jgi:NitT/TauT family transport system substrate-binding protein
VLQIRTLAFFLILFLAGNTLGQDSSHTVRVGMQAVGTFSWVIHAMQQYGIPQELGFELEATTYATKQATELALRAGEVDFVVDDFIGVVLLREQGIPVRAVYPYSKATGGVVVPEDSPIQSIEDLQGTTIGAASLDDKSLLILRALAVAEHGFDPQDASETVAAAPPLMQELLARGELDAAIPYWHFVARMLGTGAYRELASATEMLERLDLPSDLPILVVVAHEAADPEAVRTFVQALAMTTERMKQDEAIWASILEEGLYSLPDPSLFPTVRTRWEQGVPERWTPEVIDGLLALVEALVKVAGPEVVGVSRIPREAFTTEFVP